MANFSMIPKDVFERGIIRMTEGGIVTMPDKDVWMTVDEIADMLFVPSAVVFRTLRSIYKNSIAREEDTHGSFRRNAILFANCSQNKEKAPTKSL